MHHEERMVYGCGARGELEARPVRMHLGDERAQVGARRKKERLPNAPQEKVAVAHFRVNLRVLHTTVGGFSTLAPY